MYGMFTYFWLFLMVKNGKCRKLYHAWMLWVTPKCHFPSKIGFFLVVGIPINALCLRKHGIGGGISRGKEKSLNITNISIPVGSMYDIFTYIWLIHMVNVGKYTIHTWILWDTLAVFHSRNMGIIYIIWMIPARYRGTTGAGKNKSCISSDFFPVFIGLCISGCLHQQQ